MFSYLKFPLTAILMVQMFSGCNEDSVNSEDKDITKPIGNGALSYNGFTYKTVVIGTQEWTVENLRTKKYNDGTEIINITDNNAWMTASSGARCANDNNEGTVATYGYLYNWYAVNTGKLAPAGWRVATDADWTKLINFIGGGSTAGTKLKAKSGWFNNKNGTDEYGFNALPGGGRSGDSGLFSSLESSGGWWSSSSYGATLAWNRNIYYYDNGVYRSSYYQRGGFSVRLVRDK